MTSRAKRIRGDVKGSSLWEMQRAPREEEVVLTHPINELLLEKYEERHCKICENMPWMPSTSKLYPLYPYPSVKLT